MQDDRLKTASAVGVSDSKKDTTKKEESKKSTSHDEPVVPKTTNRREKKKISYPLIHIYIGFSSNNTRLTATLPNGDCIAWSTAGSSGFSGSKKATPHAANEAVSRFLEKMSKYSVKSAYVIFKGISPSKDVITRSLSNVFSIAKLRDETGYPFNGCTPPNRRAV